MSSFDNEELKEEEKLSGFEAGEDNDESFLVEETGFYPGDQPDLGFSNDDDMDDISLGDDIPDSSADQRTTSVTDMNDDDFLSQFINDDKSDDNDDLPESEDKTDRIDKSENFDDDDILSLAARFTGTKDKEGGIPDVSELDEDSDIIGSDEALLDVDDDMAFEKEGIEDDDTGGYDILENDSDDLGESGKSGLIVDDGVSMAGQIDIPKEGGSVWDLFEEEEDGSQDISDDSSVKDDSGSQVISDDIVDDDLVGFEEEEEGGFDLDDNQYAEDDEFSGDDYESSDSDSSNADVDEDLLSLIEGELEKSKKRKEQDEIGEDEDFDEESDEEFEPIDDKDADVIDISEIEAEHPSTFSEEKKEDFKMSQPIHEPAVKKGDRKKERKQRKPLPWMTIGTIAAGTIAILSVIVLSYFWLFKPELEKAGLIGGSDSTHVQAHEADSNKIAAKHEEKPAEHEKVDKPIHKDTVADIPVSHEPESHDTEKTEPVKKEPTQIEEIKKTSGHSEKPAEKPSPVQVHRKVSPVENHSKPAKKTVKQPVYKDKELALPEKPASTGLFTVQVYSSPSLKDAKDWLARVKNKNINDANISQQKIREVIWYRVRFGSFSTKEEAKQAAKNLGFTESWVDRIK